MYTLAIYVYAALAWVVALFDKKVRKLVRGHCRTFAILQEHIRPQDRVVWFHAASLGEFEQGRPIIERLRQEHPEVHILLTFFSPSGYEVRKHYPCADTVCYLPFDTPANARRFVRLAHPRVALFIKYEFWENYLKALRRTEALVYNVSTILRPTQHFFRPWGTARPLRLFHRFFVQNEQTRQLLASVGISQATVTGDTRFDRVLAVSRQATELPVVAAFADGHPTIVVGSSWEADEAIYIPYLRQHPDWRLIIAPHVISPGRMAALEQALRGFRVVRYSTTLDAANEGSPTQEDAADGRGQALLIDCYGLLSNIYRYAHVAIVGGGFGAGIHNVLEAAVYGIPVLFGPNNRRFAEAQDLLRQRGAFQYSSSDTFARAMDSLISDPAARERAGAVAGDYVLSHAGAADAVYHAVFG